MLEEPLFGFKVPIVALRAHWHDTGADGAAALGARGTGRREEMADAIASCNSGCGSLIHN